MRPIHLGLAAALRAALICGALAIGLGTAAQAAAPAVPAALLPPITKEARTQGMKEAPAVVTAIGLPCQVSDARYVGSNKDPATKVESKLYEVACTGGMGFVVVSKTAPNPPVWYDCLAIADQNTGKPGSLMCQLPGNADSLSPIKAFLTKAGSSCALANARGVGHSTTATFYEVSCEAGGGYVLKTSSPPDISKPATLSNCLAFDASSPLNCKLTPLTAQLAVADKLAAGAGKNCTVKDRRYILSTTDGSNYYEVACQDGKGYVLQEAANGSLARAIDCANADFVNGGCTLTNSREQRTEQNGLYTKLARKGGFECDVEKYGPFNNGPANHEVVELACSNRPDGAIAIFPPTETEPAVFYDCAHSELAGYRCSFSKPDAAYPKLTADLKALGKSTCVVSNSRVIGVTADKHGFVEVGCSDGLPGFMIDYTINPMKPSSVIPCGEAKGISGGCKLPGNAPK